MIYLFECVSPDFDKAGGTERYTINLFDFLKSNNYKVKLIGCSDDNISSNDFYPISIRDDININNIIVKILYKFLLIPRLIKIPICPFLLSLFFFIPRIHFKESDIVHVQRLDFLLPFIIYRKKCKKICTIHWVSMEAIKYKKHVFIAYLYRIIEKYCYKNSDYLIFINDYLKEHYLKSFNKYKIKYALSKTSINRKLFKPYNIFKINMLKKQYRIKEDEKILMFVGRLEKEKRIEFLLQVISSLNTKISNIKFIIVGDGRDKNSILENIEKLKLENVILIGEIPQNKVPDLLNCADILLLSSEFEASPTVVREAIASGVPVISNDVGDIKKIITNEFSGRVVKYDIDDYVESILNILSYDKKQVKRACMLASKSISSDVVLQKYIDVYQDLGYVR